MAIQIDGKIVVAGQSGNGSNHDFAVVRYNGDGSLDSSFNGTGKVITPIGNGDDNGNSVAIQSDGKIVVAGSSYNGSNHDFAIARYNSDGTLDTSFNGTGKLTTPVGSSDDYGYSVAVQSDGKIVVAGESFVTGSNLDFSVVRYNPNGSLDLSFNGTGKVITDVGGSGDFETSMAIQSDGKIVVVGYSVIGGSLD